MLEVLRQRASGTASGPSEVRIATERAGSDLKGLLTFSDCPRNSCSNAFAQQRLPLPAAHNPERAIGFDLAKRVTINLPPSGDPLVRAGITATSACCTCRSRIRRSVPSNSNSTRRLGYRMLNCLVTGKIQSKLTSHATPLGECPRIHSPAR
jgi:hypothetical protein